MDVGGEAQVLLGELYHEVGIFWRRQLLRLVWIFNLKRERETTVPVELRAFPIALEFRRLAAAVGHLHGGSEVDRVSTGGVQLLHEVGHLKGAQERE